MTNLRIGLTGEEEFQIVRDGDWAQVIHPSTERASKSAVPVMGPDAAGSGKNWLCQGRHGDCMTVQLRIEDGEIRVSLISEDYGRKTWRSVAADDDDLSR